MLPTPLILAVWVSIYCTNVLQTPTAKIYSTNVPQTVWYKDFNNIDPLLNTWVCNYHNEPVLTLINKVIRSANLLILQNRGSALDELII